MSKKKGLPWTTVEEYREYRKAKAADEIREMLEELGGQATMAQMMEWSGKAHQTIRKHLDRLMESGEVYVADILEPRAAILFALEDGTGETENGQE